MSNKLIPIKAPLISMPRPCAVRANVLTRKRPALGTTLEIVRSAPDTSANSKRKGATARLLPFGLSDSEATAEDYERKALISLTETERKVYGLFLTGLRWKEVSARLEMRPQTVYAAKMWLFRKLGVANEIELVQFAIRHYMLSSTPPGYTFSKYYFDVA